MGMRIRNVRMVGHRPYIYIYIARLIIEHHREWLASLADYCCDYDVCYMQTNVKEYTVSCIDDRLANRWSPKSVVHISAPNTTEETRKDSS